jgi:hypothetical protein
MRGSISRVRDALLPPFLSLYSYLIPLSFPSWSLSVIMADQEDNLMDTVDQEEDQMDQDDQPNFPALSAEAMVNNHINIST